MSSDVKKVTTEPIKYNFKWFKINFDDTLKRGDIVKFINENQQILAYGYINSNIYYKDDLPHCKVTLQNEARTIEVVVTDVLQKI